MRLPWHLLVLSDAIKAQLQQERDRLTQERQSMIQFVVVAATVEVDQTLVHLTGFSQPLYAIDDCLDSKMRSLNKFAHCF